MNRSQSSRAGEADMKEIIILQKSEVPSLMEGKRVEDNEFQNAGTYALEP